MGEEEKVSMVLNKFKPIKLDSVEAGINPQM